MSFTKTPDSMQKQTSFQKAILLKLLLLFLLLSLLFYLSYICISGIHREISLKDSTIYLASFNEAPIFSIDQIILFSSADATNVETSKTTSWLLNLHQYTDIALYINPTGKSQTRTDENTIKSLCIHSIYIHTPELGTPGLFYKNVHQFGLFTDTDAISELSYEVLPSTETLDYTKPQIYNTLTNPITLGYANKNIKTHYTITDTSSPLIFDGSLLKKCTIPLSSLSTNVTFQIQLTNQLDQKFSTTVCLDIPVYDEGVGDYGNLYNGKISKTLSQKNLYTFYRYE